MKKLFMILLAILMILGTLAGCNKKAGNASQTTAAAAATGSGETIPPVAELEDSVFDDNGGTQVGQGGSQVGQNQATTQPSQSGQTTEPTQGTTTTDPTQPGATQPTTTQPTTAPSQSTEGTQPPSTTQPSGGNETPTPPSNDEPQSPQMDYGEFLKLSAAEQKAFQNRFDSIDAFFAWKNAAKAAYEAANPSIETDGSVNLDEIAGKK